MKNPMELLAAPRRPPLRPTAARLRLVYGAPARRDNRTFWLWLAVFIAALAFTIWLGP